MASAYRREPCERIESLIAAGDAAALDAFLDTLSPPQTARAISRLDDATQAALLTLLEPEDAADLIEELSDVQAADIIEELPALTAAAIVDEMDSDHRVDVLGEMDEGDAEAILREMDPEEAEDARMLMVYDDHVAGGIMITEFVSYPDHLCVSEVLDDLRKNAEEYSDYLVQYVYVESAHHTLVGVMHMRDLVLAPGDAPLSTFMAPNPVYVLADAPIEEVEEFFDRFPFVGLPVTDEQGHLLGVIRRGDAEEALGERTERSFMRFSGIVAGDELRSMSLPVRTLGRFPWLAVNMLLNLIAVNVVVFYQHTIEAVVALAVVMPVICNMSGCSGNQALAVSIRELSLGLITPRDLLRVALKEIQVGLVNGLILGVLLGGVAFLWKGSPYLGLIAGVALATNTLLAVCLGGGLPLLLRRIKVDPALAAAPIMTTITDMCGFFLVLGLATYAIGHGAFGITTPGQ